jgi:hypothetical protein
VESRGAKKKREKRGEEAARRVAKKKIQRA